MSYVKFNIKEKNLTSGDYYNAVSSGTQVQEPEVWKLTDGTYVIVMPDRITYYFGTSSAHYLDIVTEEKVELTQKANQSIIDSDTLLKAIAISKDPKLAAILLKD